MNTSLILYSLDHKRWKCDTSDSCIYPESVTHKKRQKVGSGNWKRKRCDFLKTLTCPRPLHASDKLTSQAQSVKKKESERITKRKSHTGECLKCAIFKPFAPKQWGHTANTEHHHQSPKTRDDYFDKSQRNPPGLQRPFEDGSRKGLSVYNMWQFWGCMCLQR